MFEERLHRTLPGGLNETQLHTRIVRGLMDLPEKTATNILDDFERTLTSGRSEIRNPAAYLSTVIQRTTQNLEEEKLNPKVMQPALANRLDLLYSRFCNPEEIDKRCKEILQEIDLGSAIRAIDELEGNERTSIQNLTGFFMAILQKYMKKSAHVTAAPAALELEPAPQFMPRDLLFGYGADEYIPEMPRPADVGARAVASLNAHLPVSVEMKLEQMIAAKLISPDDLNERIIGDLRQMSESQALSVLNEFSNADLSAVRNRAAYMIGIIKKLAKLPMRVEVPQFHSNDRDEPFKRPRYEEYPRDPRQAQGPGRPPVHGPGSAPYYPPQMGAHDSPHRGAPGFEVHNR